LTLKVEKSQNGTDFNFFRYFFLNCVKPIRRRTESDQRRKEALKAMRREIFKIMISDKRYSDPVLNQFQIPV